MKAIRSICLLFLLLLIGCSPQSKSARLKKEIESVNSWTATALMAVKAWTQGNISQIYAKQTLTKTQQELAREEKTVSQDFSGQPQLARQIQQLESIVQQMTIAIKEENRTAIAAEIKQLNATQKQLNQIIKTQGGGKT